MKQTEVALHIRPHLRFIIETKKDYVPKRCTPFILDSLVMKVYLYLVSTMII